jgi:DNA invertase Pin-like site-specific DNA recombinase
VVAGRFSNRTFALKPQAYSYLRMSTDLQLKGDSRRRQLEQSRAYAEANGLELAEGAELEDIGVSAFKGANVRDGALGVFLDAVRAGTVKPGSFLLVESLDRLTRQHLLKAQSLFLSIIQAGINLVTLADGRIYPAGTNDLGDLIVSLVYMSRAHEESLIKSHRISAAWRNKRAKAVAQVPMTKWCPAWLKLANDRTHYVQIPERVEIIRGIFQDAASGMGIYSITTRLNQAGVRTFDSPNGWHTSYVAKILSNRAVLGEFQPHARENGKRVPIGEPTRDYYPAIVDEELFYRAQLAKSERRVSGAGRKGVQFTNLFSGLATCAYCKSSMKLENKGNGKKGGKYLICESALRKLGCPSLRWRYRDLETSFLAFVEEVDLDGIVTDSSQAGRQLECEIDALKGELVEVNERRTHPFRHRQVQGARSSKKRTRQASSIQRSGTRIPSFPSGTGSAKQGRDPSFDRPSPRYRGRSALQTEGARVIASQDVNREPNCGLRRRATFDGSENRKAATDGW